MRNRIINILLTQGLNLLFIAVLTLCSVFFKYEGLNNLMIFLFFGVLIFTVMPMMNYLRTLINSIISPIRYNDLYVQTVDLILSVESFDDVLRDTFDQILDFIRVQAGMLIFYYHDKDEFNIFYQKNKRKRMIRRAKISQDNILLKIINGPDDIIIKSKLDPGVHFQQGIIDELERLGGEIVVPVYYHDMFLGLIVIGGRKRKFSPGEIRLLRIFASRIAILSINSFFFSEMVRKKELEKEYELASKVQKKFLPASGVTSGRINVRVFHATRSLMIREFFDIFPNDSAEDDVRISAYRILGNIGGTSILMPGIQSVLQSFARLGFSPDRVVSRLNRGIRDRELLNEDLALLHGSIKQSGEISMRNDGYSSPMIYRKKTAGLRVLDRRSSRAVRNITLGPGDIFVICCESFNSAIRRDPARYSEILSRYSEGSLGKIVTALARELLETGEDDASDRLLMLVRMEDIA